jgi:uracil-DNA glycosylase family 4
VATPQQRQAYLDAMGIQQWVRRHGSMEQAEEAPATEMAPPPAQPSVGHSLAEKRPEPVIAEPVVTEADLVASPPARPECEGLDWAGLRAKVSTCTACDLHRGRTQTVFGVGNEQADWMIIGEAPGAEEDRQGEPFVGRAGQLLNNMLKAIGLKRESVYIANILKCRPPNNRDPRPEEIIQCEAYLRRQVELVAPKVILAVGRIAAHNLLKVDTPLGKMRGQVHHYGNTPVVVTYHPAYLLRTPRDKAKAWADLCYARSVVQGRRT